MSVLILGSGVVGQATGLACAISATPSHSSTSTRAASRSCATTVARHPRRRDEPGRRRGRVRRGPDAVCGRGHRPPLPGRACVMLGSRLAETTERPLVVFRSTMPPGTTRERLIPTLEDGSGKVAGRDFLVAYNPEYLARTTPPPTSWRSASSPSAPPSPGDAACEALRRVFVGFRAEVNETPTRRRSSRSTSTTSTTRSRSGSSTRCASPASSSARSTWRDFALTSRTAEGLWNPTYGTVDKGAFGGACLPKDTAAWLAYAAENGLPAQMMRRPPT